MTPPPPDPAPAAASGDAAIEAVIAAGLQAEKQQRWEDAAALYREALAGEAGRASADLHYRLGYSLSRAKAWAEAEPALRAALALGTATPERWHRLAHVLEKAGQAGEASDAYRNAVALQAADDERRKDWSKSWHRAAVAAERWPLAIAAAESLLSLADAEEQAEALQRLHNARRAEVAASLTAIENALAAKAWPEAADLASAALAVQPRSVLLLDALAQAQAAQKQWWQLAETQHQLMQIEPADAARWRAWAETLATLHRWPAAAAALQGWRERCAEPDVPTLYLLGWCHRCAGDPAEAELAFDAALARSDDAAAARWGIAVLHQQHGHWAAAVDAYRRRLASRPFDARLRGELGRALARCGRFDDAVASLQSAHALDAGQGEWMFEAGRLQESQGRDAEAADSYRRAMLTAPQQDRAERAYRLGWVLARLGRHQDACAAFAGGLLPAVEARLQAIAALRDSAAFAPEGAPPDLAAALSADDPDGLQLRWQGLVLLERGQPAAAASALAMSADRCSRHDPALMQLLASAWAAAGDWEAAAGAFCQSRVLQRVTWTLDDGTELSKAELRSAAQAEVAETLPLRPEVIVYESFHGARMACNPYALFLHLLQSQPGRWLHVWSLKDTADLQPAFRGRADVIAVRRGSDRCTRWLATAGVLVNNVSFPEHFSRRPGQRYLNTWHGTPIKHLGKDIRGEFLAHHNVARNLLHATHLLVPNEHTAKVLLERNDVAHLCRARVAMTGYPRTDLTLNADEASRTALRERLGVSAGQKIVLYAPTWRGEHTQPVLDAERLVADLQALAAVDAKLLFRGHHLVENSLAGLPLAAAVVPADIDSNQLLVVVDVLVTDYSSIAFDFMVTRRPLVFYAHDREAYAQARGLYFPLEELPGAVVGHAADLVAEVQRVLAGAAPPDLRYAAALARYCAHEDGSASARAAAFLLDDDRSCEIDAEPRPGRHNALLYAGALLPNGIMASFRNLLASLPPAALQITLAVDPVSVARRSERIDTADELSALLPMLGRRGAMAMTPDERWADDHFTDQHEVPGAPGEALLASAYRREFRRVFGDARLDTLIQFEGYNRYWSTLFALGRPPGQGIRNVHYMHSDIVAEYRARFSYLRGTFELARHYDALVSVAEVTRALNRAHLAGRHGAASERFVVAENLQNPARIRALAAEPLAATDRAAAGAGTLFIAIGRLSVEKGHAKLVAAFAQHTARHPTDRLWIVGDGPLQHRLRQQIDTLGLQASVLLLGARANPFQLLQRADCCVLPSNHEGQPMVLLEALILGRPIIATDIPGSRGVLAGRGGLLVDNSAEGLAAGLAAFHQGRVPASVFDAEAYQASALRQFFVNVLAAPDLVQAGAEGSPEPDSSRH